MNLTIVTPVGPGHETIVERAKYSVMVAMAGGSYFNAVRHYLVDDTRGILGCAGAKNSAIDANTDSDWLFFLDADDIMEPMALTLNNFDSPATFGAIKLWNYPTAKNVYPCGFREIAINGAGGTLTVGFFIKTDIARQLRFNDSDDTTDDFDFYLRLPSFVKIERPLVTTCDNYPSAHGPRRVGHKEKDWTGMCNELIRRAVERDPEKFNLGKEKPLSNVANTGWKNAASARS